jgi:Family of unknown function (DUF5808)/Protein of unknown function (DUF1648)
MDLSAGNTLTLALALPPALIGLMAWITPHLTRPDLFFGVTVQPWLRSTPEGRGVVRRYRLWIAANTLIALGIVFGLRNVSAPLGSLLGTAWQILGGYAVYAGARHWVLPHSTAPTTLREADIALRGGTGLPGGGSLHLGPYVLLAAAAIYLQTHWDTLPQRYPIHWGLDGRPNGWSSRTTMGVFSPLLVGLLVTTTVLLTAILMQRRTRPIQVTGAPGHAERRFRRAIGWLLLAAAYQATLSAIGAAFLPLWDTPTWRPLNPPVVVGLTIGSGILVILFALILASMGQGGSRLVHAAPPHPGAPVPPPIGDRTPDSCWKGGVFYYNPDDPALWVEKRFGIGYTLNFAYLSAWLIMAALLLGIPAILIWLVHSAIR